jgi:hypothetical protein
MNDHARQEIPFPRVFVPIERGGCFRTLDREVYQRDPDTQVIRRVRAKLRGKAAVKALKRARHARGSVSRLNASDCLVQP